MDLGLGKGDMVGIISENRPEWNFVDLGAIQLGCVLVPLYPSASSNDFEYVLNHSEAKVVFVSKKEYLDKLLAIKEKLPHLKAIFTFDKIDGQEHWTQLTDKGAKKDDAVLEEYRSAVMPEDLITLMYTSGTTGTPKGVMVTHDNLVFNIFSSLKLDLARPGKDGSKRALSFLPLCHVYEKVVFYSYICRGISIYYAESMETIGANLQEVKPHTFTTVPRLLEKVYEKIEAKANELKGLKKIIFKWAMRVADKFKPEEEPTGFYAFQLNLARKLVFSKWQAALGGNIECVISGAAALSPHLAKIFWAAGIPIMEGYGLSESTPGFSVNSFGKDMLRVGTVGRVIPGIEVRIAAEEGYRPGEGEILCKGRNVMKGYYKNPEITAETIEDGWLHSGDIGMFVDVKGNPVDLKPDQSVRFEDPYFLKITDRKKEVFKTSGGKYIAPLQLETKFKESFLIEQMAVVGEYQKFPAALIVPSFDNLKTWCKEHDIKAESAGQMITEPQVLEKFQQEIDKLNEGFGQVEKIKKFTLLANEWTIDGGELTPTLKLKRRVINEKFKAEIEDFYKGE